MIEQAEVVLELHMAEVVPVADPWVVGEMVLQCDHFALGWHVLEA